MPPRVRRVKPTENDSPTDVLRPIDSAILNQLDQYDWIDKHRNSAQQLRKPIPPKILSLLKGCVARKIALRNQALSDISRAIARGPSRQEAMQLDLTSPPHKKRKLHQYKLKYWLILFNFG